MSSTEQEQDELRQYPMAFDLYPEYKDWVANGGLREFIEKHGLEEDFREKLSTPIEVTIAYLNAVGAIPGLRDHIDANFRNGRPERTPEQRAEEATRQMRRAMWLMGEISDEDEEFDDDSTTAEEDATAEEDTAANENTAAKTPTELPTTAKSSPIQRRVQKRAARLTESSPMKRTRRE
ncbi:hypothetical protein EJ04DRAFT_563600 [Polyplosphaeria fusca]|uniref:Uncharacterized protein n=1 Tax=Polyplosphaeria fusca TaxID=682080 RepID=A0A9P4R2F7_9PLEO|nr:hypothetical protein EJ04DRAFT_563600 [Polyplosphaeria fusca]